MGIIIKYLNKFVEKLLQNFNSCWLTHSGKGSHFTPSEKAINPLVQAHFVIFLPGLTLNLRKPDHAVVLFSVFSGLKRKHCAGISWVIRWNKLHLRCLIAFRINFCLIFQATLSKSLKLQNWKMCSNLYMRLSNKYVHKIFRKTYSQPNISTPWHSHVLTLVRVSVRG